MKIKKEDEAEKRSTFAPKGGHLATISPLDVSKNDLLIFPSPLMLIIIYRDLTNILLKWRNEYNFIFAQL